MQDWSLHNAPSVRLPSIYELAHGTFPPRNDVLSVARIDFAQMIDAAEAHSVVESMIKHYGITDASMSGIIAYSGPFFFRAHQHWMERPDAIDTLNKLVRSGGPQQFADKPGLVCASVTQQEGRKFLKDLFPGDEVLGMVTKRIAAHVDIAPQKLETMMSNLAALFVGVLCKAITP